MISRIILENYMSHRRTVIEPASGLTVLVGPNNCGKSAIIHALQAICYNKPNEFAISHDQKEASVTIETDDGHLLRWRRKRGGSVSYEIDGERSDRLGHGGVPDAVHAILKMPRIEFADQPEFDVHFGLQKSPLFLLGDSPARAAGFFASSSDAERLLRMQRRHREKVRDARRESAQIGKEIEERDKTLAAMAPLPRLLGEVAQIEASHTAIEAADVGRGNLSNFLDRLNSLRRQRDGRSARATAIGPLRPPPQYHETAPLEDLIEEMRHTGQRREFLLGRLKSLSVLRSPPAPHDTARLEIALKSMRAGIVRERRQAAIIAGLASLRSPPVPKEIAGLKSVCESMEKIGQRIKSIAAGADRLQKLATPPALTDVSRLLAHVRAIKAAAARRRRFHAKLTMLAPLSAPPETLVPLALQTATARHQQALEKSRRCSKRLAELDLQLQAVREQSRRWAEDHPQCPLCGATTDADLVLAGGHAHEH